MAPDTLCTAIAATDPPRMNEHAARAGLEDFLAGVERRAYVAAEIATRHREDALEIVQDSMLSFARAYADRPAAQWPPLFQRVLQNRIRDWHRRRQVRQRLFGWFGRAAADADSDPVQQLPDPRGRPPEALLAQEIAAEMLVAALRELPPRQQQAFLLRHWEGLDTAETARVMGCSGGSVKTHLSRALARLRECLEDHHDD